MTANDLIARAARLANILAAGETFNSNNNEDSFQALNDMMDGFSAERLMIFTVPRTVNDINGNPLTVGGGQESYTLGLGGNWNVPRPPKLEYIGIIYLNNPSQPLELRLKVLTVSQYQSVPVKNIQSQLPQKIWDDGGFPYRTLSFWPVPNVTNNIALYPWTALTQFPDLTTDEEFPPGYAEMLRYNLAVRLGAEFGQTSMNPLVIAQAQASKDRVMSMNVPIIELRCDRGCLGGDSQGYYDWRSDESANVSE